MGLKGREAEQAAIRRLIREARGGQSGVLALVGEPGVGKSALLEDGAALAGGDTAVLRARGVQSEAQIPFAGLSELLRPALQYLDRIPRHLAGALEGALALVPSRAEDRFALGAATLSLLSVYAEDHFVLVLVDDIHWIDGSSADALSFAFRRLLADPVAVLLASRAGEAFSSTGATSRSCDSLGSTLHRLRISSVRWQERSPTIWWIVCTDIQGAILLL